MNIWNQISRVIPLSKLKLYGWLLGIFCVLIVVSCQRSSEQSSQKLPRPLSVRLGWQVNANSAGQIVALEKGFYLKHGLKVTLLPGGLNDPSIMTVATGVDQIGFANSPTLVFRARSSGVPLKIVSSIQHIGYHGFLVRANSGISTPKDWKGRKVGIKNASPTFNIYLSMLAKFGLKRSDVIEVPLNYGLQPFVEGEIDVYPGALTNELITLEHMGIKLSVIKPDDYGIETSGNVIFTSDEFLGKHRYVVKDFVEATLEGWQWALNPMNEAEAVNLLKKHNTKIDLAKESQALCENRRLVLRQNIGKVDTIKFQQILEQMEKSGLLEGRVELEDVVDNNIVP